MPEVNHQIILTGRRCNVEKIDEMQYYLIQSQTRGKLSSIVRRQIKEKQKYDYLLSDELLDYEYANTYLKSIFGKSNLSCK